MKKLIIIFLILSIIAGMTACSTLPENNGGAGMEQGKGGDPQLGDNVNLKDIGIEMQGENTVIHMSFINGSRSAGVDETKISSVPAFEISLLPAPERLKVDLDIGFWDYAEKSEVFSGSAVAGVFHVVQTGKENVSVYFQLNEAVSVDAQTDGSSLTLTLTPRREKEREAFFVGLNAIEEYQQGLIQESLGFSPTMCDGLTELMLISEPMNSEQEADDFLKKVADTLAGPIPTKQAYTFSMSTGSLPSYLQAQSSEDVAGEPVLQVQGVANTLPVLVENGKYLCTTPDGNIIYARSYLPDAGQDTEQVVKEELWSIDPAGRKTQLEVQDFYGVESAAVSTDGRYFAILDNGANNRILYVYDTQAGTMLNLGEEGFGNTTVSFVWDANDPVIYAMTGTNATLELKKYDFNADEYSDRVSSVEERNGAESRIALANNKLYFADQGEGVIFAVDIATSERAQIAEGIEFVLSPDGKTMAVLVMRQQDEEAVAFDLQLVDVETGTVKDTVMEGAQIENYAFGAGGDSLYLTTQSYDGVSGEYPFAFLKYSVPGGGEPELLGYSKTEKFVPGTNAGEIYMVYYFTPEGNGNNIFPVTYIYTEK